MTRIGCSMTRLASLLVLLLVSIHPAQASMNRPAGEAGEPTEVSPQDTTEVSPPPDTTEISPPPDTTWAMPGRRFAPRRVNDL